MIELRAAGAYDVPGAYSVCLRTSAAGSDGSHLYSNPDLLGHIYVGPYLAAQAEFAFVLADSEGVAGYVLGAADTRSFEAWLEQSWWPTLRAQYPRTGGAQLDDELIDHLHSPVLAPTAVVESYPAHLHIDLLPRAQGLGFGRAMLDTLLGALRERGVSGIHLDVGADNHNAVAFYAHYGFTELVRGTDSIYMGMDLS